MIIQQISPKQGKVLAFIEREESILVADGSVRSGKTTIMTMAFIIWAMDNFNSTNFAICGKTVTSAERNIILPLQQIENLPYVMSYRRSDRRLTVKCGSRENYFYVFGGKDESSYALIQGITLAGVLFDEVALMPRSFVDQAIARTLTFANAKLWFNCNPENPNHWFYQDFIKNPRSDVVNLHFLMADNPIMTPAEIEKAGRMFTGVFYQRYILGLWVRAEGVIFRQFADNPERWIIKEDELDELKKEIKFITFGIDFGESVSHTVFVATGIMRNRGGIIALDEFKLPSKGVSPDRIEAEFIRFVKQVQERFHGIRLTYAFCDHPETIVNGIDKALRREGLNVSAVMARKEEINTRIFAQEKMLNTHKMRISERCKNIIFSLKNQTWDDKHPDTRLDNNPDIADWGDGFEYSWAEFINEIGV